MYRYLLFFYNTYYPYGGMEDCVLKTNNYDDLEKFIHENYESDWYQGNITYYDVMEDKYVHADMDYYEDKDGFDKWKFIGWEEADND